MIDPSTNSSPLVDDTADYVISADGTNSSLLVDDINATELPAVGFTVSELEAGAIGMVTFSDASNNQVVADVGGNGIFSAKLSGLTDGTITSPLSATVSNGSGTTATGNSVSLDIDSSLNPTLSVNAANPADVTFTMSGLESDYSGTVTFTDSTGKSDVVPIGGNGTYSANLSNLANGTITYLMTVSNPAGNVINVDPTATLGDGSANAPSGPAQLPTLLNGYAVRPPWNVAGVDYAVGYGSTSLTDWELISQSGVTVNTSTNTVTITGNNVTLNGIDFSLHGGAQLIIDGNGDTVSNCNFLYGTSMASAGRDYIISGSGSNITIEDCVLNGNGSALGQASANQTSLITFTNSGSVTLEYNLFENFNQHVLEYNSTGVNGTIVYKYNLIENGGSGSAGAHLNYLQFGTNNDTTTATVEFNTTYQPTNPISGGEGFQFYANGTGATIDATLANNTIIESPKGDGRVHVNGSGTVTNANVYDNYFFTNGNAAFYTDPTAGTTDFYSNNVDMATGQFIQAIHRSLQMARTYTTVDDPLGTEGTIAYGINDNGKIVGAYTDNAGLDHGFLLSHGQYTTLDDPLGTEGTVAEGINARGEIVGYYTDGSGINHGFLLNKGQFTTLDDPLGTGGTVAVDITGNGKKIVGYYTDSSGFNHGFLLSKGQYTTIDDPLGAQGTVVEGINDSGKKIVGYYVDSSGIDHGFLLKNGQFTTIDDPLGTNGAVVEGINARGQVVGYYVDSAGVDHGFIYFHGQFKTLDDPLGAQGTIVEGINDSAKIVGVYYDTGGAHHGFVA